MKLYLDDDTAADVLVQLLRRAGHDVRLPADLAARGEEDPVHFRHAIREGRILVSKNYNDFKLLHDLIIEAGGHHPGLTVIRQDNDATRDLTPRGILRAITNLENSRLDLQDEYQILNHWR
jgi:predicted nuclease of predicted toxin-antitoxin system